MAGPTLIWGGSGRRGRTILAMALGELIVDKLPQTPSRLVPGGLAARAVAAALAAGSVAAQEGNAPLGALLGVAAALVAARLGAGYRSRAPQSPLGGLLAALLEDAAAYGGGRLLEV